MIFETQRNTFETQITMALDMDSQKKPEIQTGLPFFDHMLNAMAFHGKFFLKVVATGDIEVDPHHLVEDTGIVLGNLLHDYFEKMGAVARYGDAKIPMDDALGEAVVDVCNRSYLVYNVDFPQPYSGNFDMSLFKEFFHGLVNGAKINLHCSTPYGENGHHMSEALFKALGRAIKTAYKPLKKDSGQMSTKGVL